MRTYRELRKQNSSKINDSVMKWGNELNRIFSKEKVQMATKHRNQAEEEEGERKGNTKLS
jgi:hypothetical protein